MSQSPFYIHPGGTPSCVARGSKKPGKPGIELPVNNTVKLPDPLRERVLKGMKVEGFSVWAEFCRVALTEKCRTVEFELRQRDPEEFVRVYGKKALIASAGGLV